MIDLESDIYDYVAKALVAAHPNVNVSDQYESTLAELPAVTITESDNRVVERMRTDNIENAVRVLYECNVYSNRAAGRKSQAKQIADTLDDIMLSIGFTRTVRTSVPNAPDMRMHRIVMRYEAQIGPDRDDGRYLIYQS